MMHLGFFTHWVNFYHLIPYLFEFFFLFIRPAYQANDHRLKAIKKKKMTNRFIHNRCKMYPSSNCASKRSRDKLAALSLVHSKVPDTRHIPAKHYRPLLNIIL